MSIRAFGSPVPSTDQVLPPSAETKAPLSEPPMTWPESSTVTASKGTLGSEPETSDQVVPRLADLNTWLPVLGAKPLTVS